MGALHVAIDAHWLVCYSNSGISTYLRGLLEGWARMDEAVEVDLLAPFRLPPERALPENPRFRFVYPSKRLNPIASYRSQIHWQQLAIPQLVRRQKPDIYLSPFHLTPVSMPGVKVAATIHDLCFQGEPHFSRGYWLHTAELWTACLRASRLICISQATHRNLANWSPTFASKATVVHNGFEGRTLLESIAIETVKRLDNSLKPQQYLLWVGHPCDRKNLPLLFEIFKNHHQQFPDHHFVVVTIEKHHEYIRSLALNAGVEKQLRVYAADDTVRNALYRCALAFIFPSSCEGFGYPVLEAAIQGCPTISLRGTAMEEILNESVPMPSEATTVAFTEALSRVLMFSDIERENLKERLIKRAGQFSSSTMAQKTLQVLREAAGKDRG